MKWPNKVVKLAESKTLIITGAAICSVILILVVGLFYQHHKSIYNAIGYINVFPEHAASKNYRLKVGDASQLAKDGTGDTIEVIPTTNHWYSFSGHDEYLIYAASWPDGSKLEFQNIGGCIIPNKKVMPYCVADDGKGYYVEVESIGPNVLSLINDTSN